MGLLWPGQGVDEPALSRPCELASGAGLGAGVSGCGGVGPREAWRSAGRGPGTRDPAPTRERLYPLPGTTMGLCGSEAGW